MSATKERPPVDVSVIIPVYNSERWLDACLASVTAQTFSGSLELSAFNDCSTDRSEEILYSWVPKLEDKMISVVISSGKEEHPRGAGYAKNRAIEQSHGKFLCFLDADDVMHPKRIQQQFIKALQHPKAIIGCKFHRIPEGSMKRFTDWANNLEQDKLTVQVYTSNGPTVVMPTWFCSREVFTAVGEFDETGKGTPEDLIFFYRHLDVGGEVIRVDEDLLTYTYHTDAATSTIMEVTVWNVRLQRLEKEVLSGWKEFTIWNAGKQGRRLYRSIKPESRRKVVAFCDVDENKIAKEYYIHELSEETPKPRVPIIHFSKAKPPMIICMKLDLTGGAFERNLESLKLTEGRDYILFM